MYEAKKPYIMSVSGMTLEDNVKILGDVFSKYKECSISGIELNLSCPNIIGSEGYDFEAFSETLRRVYE